MVVNTDKLKWFDVKLKQKFIPKEYRVEIKNGRRFGVAKAPSGIESWRVLGMAKKK